MRQALKSDLEYVAGCFIKICVHAKNSASDIYIDGLPAKVDDQIIEMAKKLIDDSESLVLIVADNNSPMGCLIAKIGDTSFPPSNVGRVGHIVICWVEQDYRGQSLSRKLVEKAEDWFIENNISVVELSFLAQNHLARTVWAKLGYKPFRVFAHKVLEGEDEV